MRSDFDGSLTRGELFVDEQGVVRWVAIETRIREAWKGKGRYNGYDGYGVYERPAPVTDD